MIIEFIGAGPSEPGPQGLIALFLEASAAEDVEAARAMLTEGSREGFDIDFADFEGATARIGEVESEEDHVVVQTVIEEEDGASGLPFVVREEGGEVRIDFDATLGKLMGMSPDDFMDELTDSIGSAGEEGVEEVFAGPPREDAGPCEPGEWHLPQESTESFREKIVETAKSLGSMFDPAFMPFPDLLDTKEWAPEGSKIVTTRYGDENKGYTCADTLMEMEGQKTHLLDVSAYGMSEGQLLRLVWSRNASGDGPPVETAHIQVSAPPKTHMFIEGRLKFDFGWEDPATNDDW